MAEPEAPRRSDARSLDGGTMTAEPAELASALYGATAAPYASDLRPGLFVRPIALVREKPDNPRSISDERFEALRRDLRTDRTMMNARPLISLPDGDLVAGNMRHRALVEDEIALAPIFVEDLDENRQREWMLRDNNEYGDWVPEELGALVAAHRDEGGDIAALGFAESHVAALLAAHDADDNGAGGGGDEPPRDGVTPEVWGVIVDCDTEDQQAELVDELAERGLTVRALIP